MHKQKQFLKKTPKSWYTLYTIPKILSCMNFYWYNKNETKLNPVKLYVI